MKVNVSNMPINTLYKIDDNRYVIALMLKETRDGNYPSNEPSKYTEVYQIDGTGFMSRIASGKLVDNPSVFDYDKHFAIFDYDMDTNYSFNVNVPYEEANLKELYELRSAIQKSYEERMKNK